MMGQAVYCQRICSNGDMFIAIWSGRNEAIYATKVGKGWRLQRHWETLIVKDNLPSLLGLPTLCPRPKKLQCAQPDLWIRVSAGKWSMTVVFRSPTNLGFSAFTNLSLGRRTVVYQSALPIFDTIPSTVSVSRSPNQVWVDQMPANSCFIFLYCLHLKQRMKKCPSCKAIKTNDSRSSLQSTVPMLFCSGWILTACGLVHWSGPYIDIVYWLGIDTYTLP